jgi:hypothetical protein
MSDVGKTLAKAIKLAAEKVECCLTDLVSNALRLEDDGDWDKYCTTKAFA